MSAFKCSELSFCKRNQTSSKFNSVKNGRKDRNALVRQPRMPAQCLFGKLLFC